MALLVAPRSYPYRALLARRLELKIIDSVVVAACQAAHSTDTEGTSQSSDELCVSEIMALKARLPPREKAVVGGAVEELPRAAARPAMPNQRLPSGGSCVSYIISKIAAGRVGVRGCARRETHAGCRRDDADVRLLAWHF